MTVFSPEVVDAVLKHMNGDHVDDNVLIVRAFSGREATEATMNDLDEQGGTWRYVAEGEEHQLHIPWPSAPLSERPEIRREVVVLYDAACDKLGVTPRVH